MKKITKIVLLLAGLLFTAGAFAQGVTTSALGGQVTDDLGEPLPGANILAVHTPTGTRYGAATDFDGFYRISNMRSGGPYTITISYVGFEDFVKRDVYLSLGQTERVSTQMSESAEALDEIILTVDNTGIFDSNKTGASTNISQRNIQTLPTVSRSIADFVRLTPQAQITEGTDGFSISIAGQNNRYNAIYVDGAVNNDVFGLAGSGTNGGQTGVNPFSVDAIESFQVSVAPFDVRISGFAGGAINAITRSGTNEWRGTAYGFVRNEGLAGKTPPDLVGDDGRQKLPEFNATNYGLSIGGPIIKDKLFFFINYEREDRDTPQPFAISEYTGNATEADITNLRNFVQNQYGYNIGTFDGNPQTLVSNRVVTKIDYNINDNHKLVFSWRYTDAENLENRNSNSRGLGFSNGSELFASTTNSITAELNSRFGNKFANSLIVGYTGVRDDRDPAGDPFPTIRIEDGSANIDFGAERFSTANLLNTDVVTITNNFEIYSGRHNITIGTHNEFTSAKNLFFPSNYGYYIYDDLDSFLNNEAAQDYQHGYSVADNSGAVGDASSGAAEFNFIQLGFYVQDEVNVNDNLKVTGGIRFDIPIWEDGPVNDDFNNRTTRILEDAGKDLQGARVGRGVNTSVHISPRLGFNWDVNGNGTTQVRGGLGIFTSRLPLVWPGGTYNNNGGVTGGFSDDTDFDDPIFFNPNVGEQPQHLDAESGDRGGNVDLFAADFMLPQIMRYNVAVDQKLPFWGLIATADFVYSDNITAIFYENLNIGDPVGNIEVPGDNRPIYARGSSDRVDGTYGGIYLGSNTNEGYSWNASFTLTKPMDENGFAGSFTYSYGDSYTIFDGTSSQNSSQWRGIQTVNGKNRAELGRSDFAQGHRFLANFGKEFKWTEDIKTYIGFVYEGLEGQPFSHVYSGRDVLNDDSRDNALIYVPANANEIQLVDSNMNGTTADEWNELNAFIENDDYLRSRRGQYTERNGDRYEWSHVIDLKFLQDFTIRAGGKKHTLQASLDIFNFTNLLNKDWGKRYIQPGNYSFLDADTAGTSPVFEFDPQERNVLDDVGILSSRWQMQIGLRYIFN
jgi:outer membrane receptor for ferrienterochelin and colicin